MAVAFDASTESIRTATTDPYTFSHTGRAEGSGGIQGVVLTAINNTSATNHITGAVTYGGVAMTRVAVANDTSTELGRAEIWFVGYGLTGLGGTQTVSVDLASATGDDFQFVAITLTADSSIDAIASSVIEENAANPSVTLPYSGRTAIAIAAIFSGLDAVGFTPNGNCTALHDHDFGSQTSHVIRQTTPGSTDFAIGGTQSTDDLAFAAAAFAEHSATAGFPDLVQTFNSGESVNRTTFSVQTPAVVAGDRLICVILHGDSADTGSAAPTDWTRIDSSFAGIAAYERIFSGSVAAGTVSFSQASNNWWVAQVFHVKGSHASNATEISARAGASSNVPNAASLSPSGGADDYLWLSVAGYGHALGTDRRTTAFPSSYNGIADSDPSGNLGQVNLSSAWRQVNGSSENPGSYTISGSLAWIAFTLAVPPDVGVTLVDLAGNQPAGSGTLAVKYLISLAGNQPEGAGAFALIKYLIALAGDQPAATGTPLVQYLIALAGDQPAGSGTIASVQLIAITLEGNQPAGSGALTPFYLIALAGNQPAASGTPLVLYLISLAGDQPSASGTPGQLLLVVVAGDQPFATGALTPLYQILLAGDQPSAAGQVLVQYLISLAGDQPAASSSLSVLYQILLQGDQPAPSGLLAVLQYVLLQGNQGAPSGELLFRLLQFVYGRARYAPQADGLARYALLRAADQTRYAPITDNARTRYAARAEGRAQEAPLTEGQAQQEPTAPGEARYG